MTELTLDQMKQLSSEQYEQARSKAIERVRNRIGDKPTRKQYQRELGQLWTALDVIALIVFLAALAVSSLHIVVHMGELAAVNAPESQRDLYIIVHQVAFVFLAEGAMILFLVMFGLAEQNWRKWVYLVLAGASVVFVIVANVQSQIGILESLLAPAFTIGVGLKLEHLIVQSLARRDEVSKRYLEALAIYESSILDETKHPEFDRFFKQSIWEKLLSISTNKKFADAPAAFKAASVRRELQRDAWTSSHEEVNSFSAALPLAQAHSGHQAPTMDGHVNIQLMPSANGHTAAVLNN